MKDKLLNFALFQVGWFFCVVGAAEGWPWLGALAAWPIVALAFWGAPDKKRLATFLGALVVFGFVTDTVLELAGIVRYPEGGRLASAPVAPLWILTLWALFGTLFHRSLRWLLARPLLSIPLTLVGTPLSFWAGVRLEAVEIPWSLPVSLVVLGLAWALAMPLLLGWARRLDPWSVESPRVGAWGWVGGALWAGVLGVFAFEANGGLDYAEVRSELLALSKNRPIAALGLAIRTVHVETTEGASTFEVSELVVEPAEPSGRAPVLLVHGTPSSLFVWTRVLFASNGTGPPEWAAGRRVLAPDLPGHGATGPADRPTTFDGLVAFLETYLKSHGVERAVVVGHSYGGEVAWRFAVAHPERVERLVLMASSGYRRTREETPKEELLLKEHPLAYWGRLATTLPDTREVLEISFVESVPPGEAEENFVLVQNRDNWRAMVELAREEEGYWESRIREIRCPTLILWGEEDGNFAIDRHATRFAADIPGAELVRIPDCNHYVPVEKPDIVALELARFLR